MGSGQTADEVFQLLSDVTWCDGPYETMQGADVLVILTEWNQFRNLDLARIKDNLTQPSVVDLRNIYDPTEMREKGFHYSCVGRSFGRDKPGALIGDGTTLEDLA